MELAHGLGYRPDTHDKSRDPTLRHLLGARVGAPPEFSLAQYIDVVRDQLQTSCCTGFAFARAAHVRCAVLGTPIAWPSPVNIYTVGRLIDQPGGPLQDQGAMPSQVSRGMVEWGVTSDAKWPFDPAHIDDMPDFEELLLASMFTAASYRIDTVGAERLADIEQAVSSGYPVPLGIQVDQAFMDYAGGSLSDGSPALVQAPDPNQILGGHMLCCLGYKKDGPKTVYLICNSWGATQWGNAGLCWADPTFMTSDLLTDLFALNAVATHAGAAQ